MIRTLLLTLRRHSWRSRLRPLLYALACLQVVAPATAAVADAWRLDRREPYAHIEQEGGTGCAVVHDDHCLLCSITTTPQERTAAIGRSADISAPDRPPVDRACLVTPRLRLHLAPSRAPPVPIT